VDTVAIALGVVLGAGTALAQMAGPTLPSPSPSIVPVTGPSTGTFLESTKAGLASTSPTKGTIEEIRVDKATPAAVTATAPAPRAVKAVHKPGAKATVKKASAPKRAKIAAKPAKTKQVASAKRRASASGKVVSKTITPAKSKAPAKSGAPSSTVLPRV
jgi:hypothetical protein